MKDVVVLLPGILGSVLEKDGRSVWDLNAQAIGRAAFSLGGSIQELALSGDGSSGDGVVATKLLQSVHLIPYLWKIDGYGYSELSAFLQAKLALTRGENFFEFPYDWRLDNRISAQRLANVAMEWLEQQRRRYADARLIFIGHSMGGLVARYFIEVLGGWRVTKLLITLGTPHRGSVKALDFLVNGVRKRIGPVTLVDLSRMVQTFPSVCQLLPIYAAVGTTENDLQSLETINRRSIGGMDVERARAGIAFHREIERAVEVNRREADYAYRIIPVVGSFQPTFLSALLTEEGVTPLLTYKGDPMLAGDGTVPHFSAVPIELSRTKGETFVACPHATLQNFAPVRVQTRAVLMDLDISEIKAVGAEAISLEIQDAFFATEVIRGRARCTGTAQPLRAVIQNLETHSTIECIGEITDHDGWQELDAGKLAPGAYRMHVEADSAPEPVEDVFVVVNSDT